MANRDEELHCSTAMMHLQYYLKKTKKINIA